MNRNYRNEYIRNINNYCKSNNKKFKVETSEIDMGFFMEKPILMVGFIDEKVCKKLERNIKEAHSGKTIICYFCPNSILVLMYDNYTTIPYSRPFKYLENWFRNNKTDLEGKRECSICFEKDYFKIVCETCFNTICQKCYDKLEICPFCREQLVKHTLIIRKK